MTRISLLLILATACTADLATGTSAITGGTPEAGYPAVFSLAYNGQGGCTGTCVTPKVATTAQHCVEGETASTLSGLFGPSETAPTKTIKVTAIGNGPNGSDIAVIAFAEACPAFIPFNRTPLEMHVGEPVVMVGFGVTTEQANDAGIKRSGNATLFSVSTANVPGMKTGELATSNDPDGTCNGDSGGPTFMTFNSTEYMVGTTSRGSLMNATTEYPCGQGRSIAVRADTYASFIDAFIAIHDPGAGEGSGSDNPDGGGSGSGSGGGSGSGPGDPSDGNDDLGGCATTSNSSLLVGLVFLALVGCRRRSRR